MNYRSVLAGLLLALSTVLMAPPLMAQTGVAGETLDRVVAVVDDDVIMASELQLQVLMMASQIRAAGQEAPPQDYLQRQVLEKLIVESLQLQLGERAGVKVGEEQLQQAMSTVAAQNRMSIDDFMLALQKEGIPPSMFKENLRRQIIVQQVQQGIVSKRVDISEQDVENFIKSEEGRRLAMRAAQEAPIQQTRTRHILVKTSAIRNDGEAETLLQSLRATVQRGGDFAALAKQYSEDPGSALKGGDLGWTAPGQMVPEFEQMTDATAVGEVSPPFRSQFGWHILQVQERREQDMSEEILRQQAEIILRKRSVQDELPRWLKELRDKAYVQIKL